MMKPISEMRRVCESATSGEWGIGWEHECMAEVSVGNVRIAKIDVDTISMGNVKRTRANAQFIAEARTQWPELIEWAGRARPWLQAFISNIEGREGTGHEIIIGHGTYKKLVELKKLLEELPE